MNWRIQNSFPPTPHLVLNMLVAVRKKVDDMSNLMGSEKLVEVKLIVITFTFVLLVKDLYISQPGQLMISI